MLDDPVVNRVRIKICHLYVEGMNSILTLFTNKVEGKNRNPITNIMRKKFLPNRVGKNRILSQCDGKKFFPLRPTAVRGRAQWSETHLDPPKNPENCATVFTVPL